MKILVYLHGFLSSPRSQKGLWLRDAAQKEEIGFLAPDLNRSPLEVKALLDHLAEEHCADELFVVGSSLGGFYAYYLAQISAATTALLNPAMVPWKYAGQWLGEQPLDEGGSIWVKPSYPEELKALAVTHAARPQRILAVLGTADQTLDWHESFAILHASPRWVVQGADHRLSDFSRFGPAIMDFLFHDRLPPNADGVTLYLPSACAKVDEV